MDSQNLFLALFGAIVCFTIYKSFQRKKLIEMLRQVDLKAAQIIDVRSKSEFSSGSFPGSINIPLEALQSSFKKLNINKQILVCCASGARSSMAKRILHKGGAKDVHNIGAWHTLLSI